MELNKRHTELAKEDANKITTVVLSVREIFLNILSISRTLRLLYILSPSVVNAIFSPWLIILLSHN